MFQDISGMCKRLHIMFNNFSTMLIVELNHVWNVSIHVKTNFLWKLSHVLLSTSSVFVVINFQ